MSIYKPYAPLLLTVPHCALLTLKRFITTAMDLACNEATAFQSSIRALGDSYDFLLQTDTGAYVSDVLAEAVLWSGPDSTIFSCGFCS